MTNESPQSRRNEKPSKGSPLETITMTCVIASTIATEMLRTESKCVQVAEPLLHEQAASADLAPSSLWGALR
jgi:hypothetical protein